MRGRQRFGDARGGRRRLRVALGRVVARRAWSRRAWSRRTLGHLSSVTARAFRRRCRPPIVQRAANLSACDRPAHCWRWSRCYLGAVMKRWTLAVVLLGFASAQAAPPLLFV